MTIVRCALTNTLKYKYVYVWGELEVPCCLPLKTPSAEYFKLYLDFCENLSFAKNNEILGSLKLHREFIILKRSSIYSVALL